jgi:hypothetical protein
MNAHQVPRVARHLRAALILWLGLHLWPAGIAAAELLEIADSSGKPVLVLPPDGARVSVVDGAGALLLQGNRKGSDYTAYILGDGSPLGIAKGDGDRFKLEAPDGRLLRKVKRDGDRVKVSDNEENADAAAIRRQGDDTRELELGPDPNGKSFGKTKDYPDQGLLRFKDRQGETRYTLAGTPLTPAPLVLLIPGLPPEQARTVMAEIWLRGG